MTVGVAEWLGRKLAAPRIYDDSEAVPLADNQRWPAAAWGWGSPTERWQSHAIGMWPKPNHIFTCVGS